MCTRDLHYKSECQNPFVPLSRLLSEIPNSKIMMVWKIGMKMSWPWSKRSLEKRDMTQKSGYPDLLSSQLSPIAYERAPLPRIFGAN